MRRGSRVFAGAVAAVALTAGPAFGAASISDVTMAEGTGGTTDFVFSVTDPFLSIGTSCTYGYTTSDGTATAPADYVPQSGVATITNVGGAGGSTTITVPVVGDAAAEPDETFTVTLSPGTCSFIGSPIGPSAIDDGTGVGTIVNDDAPPPPPDPCDAPGAIRGTEGNDILRGSEGPDVICGFGGQDTIYGYNGDDTVYAGEGNDVVYGAAGLNKLYGRGGADKLYGGNEDETLDGGSGADQVSGGTGNDTLTDGAGNDVLSGGSGSDKMTSGAGDDTLRGGDGNDDLKGEADSDKLFGEGGNDALDGGDGTDACTQGAGTGPRTGCES